MEKLTESSHDELLAYLHTEPEYNIFIIGDIHNFGFNDPIMDLYAQRNSDGQFICILMRYQDSFVCYSHCPTAMDLASVVAQIQTVHDCSGINGKGDVIDLLIPFFPNRPIKRDYLAVLRTKPHSRQSSANSRRLVSDQSWEIIDLYTQVEEFAVEYKGHEDVEIENTRTNLQKGGRCYGIHIDGKLVSAASTSAESDNSAIIVGVCTHPDFRGKGYATALVAQLCADCMDDGLSSLCLFYDNPAAGSIYRQIGFVEMGQYTLLRRGV